LELLDSDPDPNKGMPIRSTDAMYKYLMCLGFLKVELNTDSLADEQEQEETASEDVDGGFLVNTEPSEGTAKKQCCGSGSAFLLDPDLSPRSKEIDQN
jgi:hypothetical protein